MSDEPELKIKIIDEGGEQRFPDEPMPADQPTVDASSVEDFRKKEDDQTRMAREDRELLAAMLGDVKGRRLLWGILDKLHPFQTVFGSAGFPDPNAQFYHLGQQQAGMAIYQTWLTAHPAEVAAMHRENDSRLMPPPEKKTRRRKESNG